MHAKQSDSGHSYISVCKPAGCKLLRACNGDARARVAVEAAPDDVGERGIAQRGHVDGVAGVGDGVHLLNEGQRREGRVAVAHLYRMQPRLHTSLGRPTCM